MCHQERSSAHLAQAHRIYPHPPRGYRLWLVDVRTEEQTDSWLLKDVAACPRRGDHLALQRCVGHDPHRRNSRTCSHVRVFAVAGADAPAADANVLAHPRRPPGVAGGSTPAVVWHIPDRDEPTDVRLGA